MIVGLMQKIEELLEAPASGEDAPTLEHMEETLAHRILTGYYPRLVLALNQHFASKGGYIVHFAGPEGPKLVADSDWVVP